MTDAEILELVKVDLGELYPSQERTTFLTAAVAGAKSAIEREGVRLTDSTEDGGLVAMYAAWRVRKRATNEPIPRMLRWALNNRLFSQKAGAGSV